MRNDIEKYELIERYLNSQLSGKELVDFEQGLNSDPELADELKRHKEIRNLVYEGTLLEIRETVKEIHEARYFWNIINSRYGKIVLIIVAGILIFLRIGYAFVKLSL
jgi:hypothetical protein